jgi:Subtilase family
MPNNPVQIVLNDDRFIRAPDPGRGGPDKDFFDGNDRAFEQHKEVLLSALSSIEARLETSPDGPLAYVRVRMRIEAIAKSYRPNRAIFLPEQFPCVGAAAPGELFFRMPRVYLQRLRSRIAQADMRSEKRTSADGKSYIFVSRARSELGAIETIEIARPDRKRTFAAAAGVSASLHPNAASGYIIELFEQGPLQAGGNDDILGLWKSFDTFQRLLHSLGRGLHAALLPSSGGIQGIELILTNSSSPPLIEDRRVVRGEILEAVPRQGLDQSVERHEQVLDMIAQHSLVRMIKPPIIFETAELSSVQPSKQPFNVPSRIASGIYPKVGVIDTGIADCLGPWILHRHDFLDVEEIDPKHGTSVGGVLIAAQGANGTEIGREIDGCDLVDIPLLSTKPFMDVYGTRGFEAFLEELEAALTEARDQFGVRIFNMSLNLKSAVEQDYYSVYAARLDEIQDRLGVTVVNSAGNLESFEWRQPWQKKPGQVLAALAARSASDAISIPCESVRALAVGALNPPGCKHIAGVPATYTRRGPGMRVGVKPDLSHYGGAGDQIATDHTGFVSCADDGSSAQVRGTSFAAPLVAKTLATLDVQTGERLKPRTLRAFLVHNSVTPAALSARSLKEIARQFVGFGQPSAASPMLETDDHGITLVFESRLTVGERRPAILRFPFSWPISLVDPGTRSCRGTVRMTMVYDPPTDPAFGTEFVRVNLDAMLQQRQPIDRKDGKPSWRSEIRQVFLPKTNGITPPERALIDHGLKWWPTKRYEDDFGDGVGQMTEWRLEVESNVRAEAQFPAEGVPFSIILTIEDHEKQAPIFQEVRRQLVNTRVDLQDIRTPVRIRTEVGKS